MRDLVEPVEMSTRRQQEDQEEESSGLLPQEQHRSSTQLYLLTDIGEELMTMTKMGLVVVQVDLFKSPLSILWEILIFLQREESDLQMEVVEALVVD